jgi:amidohydrolase
MSPILSSLDDALRENLANFYRDLHQHPELSFQEHRTAEQIVKALASLEAEVTTGVGGTGVVAVICNGEGPTVMLRADIDALPVAEETGLPYRSREIGRDSDGAQVPVMHACGHDMHATCLVGAITLLSQARRDWSGTVVAVFQPAEEVAAGARAMVADGLFERFPRPQIVLGQHVAPLPAGVIGDVPGPAMAAATIVRVTLFGRGGHGSRPETTVDPVVMAAAVVLRLQTIVAREIPPAETAVVTVGYLRAGTKENVIPAEAELGISVRTFAKANQEKILAAIERIVRGEAAASGANKEPEVKVTHNAPLLTNDVAAAETTVADFTRLFGADRVVRMQPVTGSEDVGILGAAAGVPTFYWFWGGPDREAVLAAANAGRLEEDIPSNHSPGFAPVIEPTITTGVQALVSAALTWLASDHADND